MNKLKPWGIALILLSTFNFALSAKNIYLISTGSDTNSGQTEDQAVKTLSMAITLAQNEDIIHVLDFIDISQEPVKTGSNSINDINTNGSSSYQIDGKTYTTWNVKGNNGIKLLNRKLTIKGITKATSGFDGQNLSRLLYMDGVEAEVTFSNLTFKNGNSLPSADSGAGMYIKNSNPVFESCDFISNQSNQGENNNMRRGGAAFISSNATFRGCNFQENLSREGSALYLASGNIFLENCIFENHDNSALKDADGGALYVTKDSDNGAFNLTMKACVFKDNASKRDGGALYICDKGKNVQMEVHAEACSFINNKTTSQHGGAVYIDNSKEGTILKTRFINSTFYGNQAGTCGGALNYQKGRVGSELSFINCTVTGNRVAGNNVGLGPGFRFHCETNTGQGDITTRNVIKRFYNCIIENNHIAEDSSKGIDMSFRAYTPENNVDFFLYNSFVGRTMSLTQYVPLKENSNYFGYDTDALAGLAQPATEYINNQYCIPLYENSVGSKFGNARFLKEINVNSDQLGNPRLFANEQCAVGAVEVPVKIQGSGEPQIFEHILLYGQSLSSGDQTYPTISPENVEGNYMIGSQVWINYGNTDRNSLNPLIGNISATSYNSPGYMSRSKGARAESPLYGLVNHLQLNKQDDTKILASSCGTGGTSIEELSKESETRLFYNDFLYSMIYANKAVAEVNSTISCPAIFWMQGEFNYSPNNDKGLKPGVPNTTTKNGYKALLVQLKNNMQQDVMSYYGQDKKPVFITYQTGAQYMRDTLSISMAQLEASNEHKDIICAGPHYQVTDRGGHLDANGSRWYGEMLAKVYHKTQIEGKDFKPLQPKEICRGTNPNQLIIQFHVPAPPLAFDTQLLPKIQNYGFEVFLNEHKNEYRQSITNIQIDNDCVILTCSNPLNGNVLVSYAGSKVIVETKEEGKDELHGHGNLRDSDPYQARYTYIDLDKKDDNGAYVYPREDWETTLRPDYEPMDASGNIIYNQPYPLYNFCVGFFYTLEAGKDKLIIPGVESGPVDIKNENKKLSGISVSYLNDRLCVKSTISGRVNVYLYTIDGRLIRNISDMIMADELKEYTLRGVPSGLYPVKVMVEGDSIVTKVLVQ